MGIIPLCAGLKPPRASLDKDGLTHNAANKSYPNESDNWLVHFEKAVKTQVKGEKEVSKCWSDQEDKFEAKVTLAGLVFIAVVTISILVIILITAILTLIGKGGMTDLINRLIVVIPNVAMVLFEHESQPWR